MNKYLKTFKTIAFFLIIIISLFSCRKYDNPPSVFENIKDLVDDQRKVLIISIDGVSGSTMKSIAPTNIALLENHSKYSYEVLRSISDAGGWVSMLTGTAFAKHAVRDDNFERSLGDDHDHHSEMSSSRNVLDYVTQYKPVRTAMITPWQSLRGYIRNADYSPNIDNDLKVKDSAVHLLNTVQSLGTVIVNFRAAHNAGEKGGYNLSNSDYKQSITQSDQYLGEILTAMRARKNFDRENWLVIVTTNVGGGNADINKGFVLVNNPSFAKFELKKSGYSSILFDNTSINAEVTNDRGLYDAGASQDFTVQMDVKFNSAVSWPGFLSKSTDLSGANFTGWLWMQSDNDWSIVFGGSKNGGEGKNQIDGANGEVSLNDNKWHTLTMVVKTTGGTTPTERIMTAYIDGVQTSTGSLLHQKSLTVKEALRVGYRSIDNSGTELNNYSANLTYFNKALDAETIAATHNMKDITQHPDYTNLIGFWPMDEGVESTFYNHVSNGYDMRLRSKFVWNYLGKESPSRSNSQPVVSNASYITTPNDIAALILYWMKIEILNDFGFDGTAYLKNFELEFLKN